jgi:hypothetical protein
MKLCMIVLFSSFLSIVGFSSSSSSASSESSSEGKMMGVSDEKVVAPKNKLRGRIKGNFKGKDPMIAPDGQSELPPTDGSRPNP